MKLSKGVLVGCLSILLVLLCPASALAASDPGLGSAAAFGVLGGSTVTNTGPTSVGGLLGVSPGTAITGFPPGSSGVRHVNPDAVAVQAKADLDKAYANAAGAVATTNLTGKNLGGQTLAPGVYKFNTSAQLTGALTLSGVGVYIFQTGSTLTTESGSTVALANGAQACAVFWQVGSSATVGTGTAMVGTIMAMASITMTTGASLQGRALARNGAVTLDSNRISQPGCAAPAPPPAPVAPVKPASPLTGAWPWLLALVAAIVLGVVLWRRRNTKR